MVNAAADADAQVMRISMDAKAAVKVGDFSRGGKKRVLVKAADHDFRPKASVTPVGILVPQSDELFLACVTSKVTSDCLVDVLEEWWQSVRDRFEQDVADDFLVGECERIQFVREGEDEMEVTEGRTSALRSSSHRAFSSDPVR